MLEAQVAADELVVEEDIAKGTVDATLATEDGAVAQAIGRSSPQDPSSPS